MSELDGKVALVTGGASGIGRATAIALARAGARVVVSDIQQTAGQETVWLIKEAAGDASFVPADVSQAVDVQALVAAAVHAYGRLDVAFNNAGIGGPDASTADTTDEQWDEVLSVNLKGVWLCMKYEIAQMLVQGGGTIVNTASIYGLGGAEGAVAYCAAKHGVVGLTRVAAIEYARQGIRVNAVCPGYIDTPMTAFLSDDAVRARALASVPAGRIGRPEEVAEAVVWLCSAASSYLNGHPLVIDGAYMAV